MKGVKVVFDGGFKEYSYACFDDNVKAGDYYVVLAPDNRPAVVKIVTVNNKLPEVANKALLYKLDLDSHISSNSVLQKRIEAYKDTKRKLDEKLDKFQQQSVYQLLAQHDAEAAALLKQLSNY